MQQLTEEKRKANKEKTAQICSRFFRIHKTTYLVFTPFIFKLSFPSFFDFFLFVPVSFYVERCFAFVIYVVCAAVLKLCLV